MAKIKRFLLLFVLFCVILTGTTGCALIPFSELLKESLRNNGELSLPQNTPLKYTLKEEVYDQYTTLLSQVKENMLAAQTCEDAEAEMEKINDRIDYFRKQSKIAEILYYCDQDDKEANDAYLYACEILNKAYLDAVNLEQEIYKANPVYRDEYFEEMTEEEVEQAVREAKAERDYQDFQADLCTQFYGKSEDELYKNAHTLYTQQIKKGTAVAKEMGYDSFYDYAAENFYFRDFGKEERDAFRSYVKAYIVPLYQASYQNFSESYAELNMLDQEKLIRLMDTTPYDELDQNYLTSYLNSLSGSTKESMMHMFDNNYFVCADWDGALEGALTTMIDDPFCYFGPGYYQTTFTVAHELGHYYATLFLDSEVYSFDIAETHSQGNEMLLLHYLKSEINEDLHTTLVNFKIYSFAKTILISTVLDEFEETVYSDAKYENYTTEQFTETMEKIAKKYQLPQELQTLLKTYWIDVCITSPVYYISYATSAIASLDLYRLCTTNEESAKEAYRKIVEEQDEESNFVVTLKNAGLHTPFEEAAYINLMNLIGQKPSRGEILVAISFSEKKTTNRNRQSDRQSVAQKCTKNEFSNALKRISGQINAQRIKGCFRRSRKDCRSSTGKGIRTVSRQYVLTDRKCTATR